MRQVPSTEELWWNRQLALHKEWQIDDVESNWGMISREVKCFGKQWNVLDGVEVRRKWGVF